MRYESPTDFSALFEALDSPHAVLTTSGKLIAANASFKALFDHQSGFREHEDIAALLNSDVEVLRQTLHLAAGLSDATPLRLDLPGSTEPARRQAVAKRIVIQSDQPCVLIRLRRRQENTDVFATLNGKLDVLRKRLGAEAHARRILADTNDDLEKFASVAAHDLRSPLGQVQMMTQLIRMDGTNALSDKQQDLLDDIELASSRLGNLVSALLRHAKASGAEPHKVDKSLNDIVDRAVGNVKTSIEEQGAQIEISELPTLKCDPILVTQIFQNLLGNALKYTEPTRKPHIRIFSEDVDGNVHIAVADNGRGFDGADPAQMFDAFSRLSNSGDQEGAGIGLATCMSIAKKHRWKMSAKESDGQGATFYIVIPKAHIVSEGRGSILNIDDADITG